MILHGYWRSTASYRVRIALNLKGLSYDQVTHDLRAGRQRDPDYVARQPQGLVPALETGAGTVIQSSAILEWLEECHPAPPLLPDGPLARATVRSMAALIACDVHPLNNLRVLEVLRRDLSASPDQVDTWIARWITQGFTALETLVAQHGRGFAFGDAPTLADCYLVPQIYSAERFNVPLSAFPRLMEASERARALPAFGDAHPARQPDADR